MNRKVDTGIVKRGNSYHFTAYLGYDAKGKQIRKTTTYTPPDDISERKADKLAKEEYINFKNRCKGLASLNENMRFNDLVDEYFKVYAPNKLKPITVYNYQKMIAFHFSDYFGNMKLKDINTGMLTDFFCKLCKTDKNGNTKPLKSSTVKRVYIIFQSVMHFAYSQHYIKENPCNSVILPEKDCTTEERRKFLTEEELPVFLSMFNGYSILNTIVKLLLYTGMRSGECLGLQWDDIDFEKRTIFVHHTLSDVGGRHFLTTPKTRTSKRILYMNQTVYDLLKEHKKHQYELRMSMASFEHPEMVFTSEYGNYKDRSCLNSSFKCFLRKTDFSFMTLHCLRHTNATLLLNNGVDLKIVSDHLGHSDIGTTGNIYADVLASSRQKTAEIIDLKMAK